VTSDQWAEVERLLHEALRLSPTEQAKLLANIDDLAVRAEVTSLIEAEREPGPTLGGVVRDAAAAVLDQPMPGRMIGHFRVIKRIGRGGMGEVFLAHDVNLQRDVALKVLPIDFHSDRERLLRFEREARAAAALNHPHIVTVHEVGHSGGHPFIATELLEGETIAQRLTRGALPLTDTLRMAMQIADALAAAHAKGIVHRDLKPANVMITGSGVKVLDFGLAKFDTHADMLTATKAIMGTPGYMAPEQWEGRPADARTDIYAFGCLVYEMAMGRRVETPRAPVPSRPLDRIVRKCLQPDPADRWASAGELMREVERTQQPRASSRWIAVAAVAAGLALAGTFVWRERTSAKPLTDKDVLLLSDFTNTTGDPVFDGTLRQALAIQLEQSPFLKIMDDGVVRQTMRLMGHAPTDRITSEIARDICVREAATASVEGAIASLGRNFVVTLEALTCQDRGTLAREQAQAEDKEHVLQALGTAATTLRARLGESLSSIEQLNQPLDQFTTTSLAALQTYARGYELAGPGQFIAAIPFFRRATELDPNFAMAYQILAIMYSNSGERARSNEYQRRAFELADRVSEFERLSIVARYYFLATGELNKAEDAYQLVIRGYPRYWGSHSELSTLYRTTGGYEKSLVEAQAAVRLEPRLLAPHNNMAMAYVRLDRLGEAKDTLRKVQSQHPDAARIHQRLLEIAYAEGNTAAAEEQINWFSGKAEEYTSLGIRAANADARGQRRRAHELYRQAADLARRRDLTEAAAEFEEADAFGAAATGNCAAGRRAGAPPLALALCGDANAAELVAADRSRALPAGTIWNAVQLPAIRAATELRRGEPARTITLLASAAPYDRAYPEVPYLRGLAYLRLKQSGHASAEFRKVLDHKGANWGVIYAMSQLGLARAATLSGNTVAASKAYQDFLALWKDGDIDSAVLADARSELSALK
jgi:tetratricopeptide (TPR) repeat protein